MTVSLIIQLLTLGYLSGDEHFLSDDSNRFGPVRFLIFLFVQFSLLF